MAGLIFSKSKGGQEFAIELGMANRHGLVAGATGTGKTVTLQTLAEQFSQAGVSVFMADVKGDLAGLSMPGAASDRLKARIDMLKIEMPKFQGFPTMFWDVFGKSGHPLRTTISEMGPHLLSRLMNLNETQSSVLQVIFQIADDSNLLILDMKDLTALLQFVQENLDRFKDKYGHLAPASLGTIQRALLNLQSAGGDGFFGEPAFNVQDLLQADSSGRGYINILAADKLMSSPLLYSTFLLWLLSELFETLPEVGDREKPKLVFFFDEAHLLFKDAPKVLLEKIEQVVRLIRSKGVGVYFVTQSPSDIPVSVLGQLANRVQHALRAFTPVDQKAVKVAAQTMRPNPKFSTEERITNLGVGEALISVLDASGTPGEVEEVLIFPPSSRIGPINDSERSQIMSMSPVAGFYEKQVDRESAFEIITANKGLLTANANGATAEAGDSAGGVLNEILFGSVGPRGGRRPGLIEKAAGSATRSIASSIGREVARGLLGSLLGGGTSRRKRY